ncbi:glycoside hydrolase family 31 protein [Lutibacter citreus]|uniref:glycoside hydrolase family 31 protein n=1 Tax=Lutibacter citreus TaxID=2138210 RepID=UPI000DBE0FFA|nr:TIM-barrel domain-containing protein [Lutibacter citreus]
MTLNLKLVISWMIIISALLIFNSCSKPYEKSKSGIIYEIPCSENESIKKISISVLSPVIIKVSIAENDSLLVVPSIIAKEKLGAEVRFDVSSKDEYIKISTDSIIVYLDKKTGEISFHDVYNSLLLATTKNEITPYKLGNDSSYKIKQHFLWTENEALYGLGQHELNTLNLRGQKIELSQHNTRVSIPVLLSTKGYGLYWDNYSQSYYQDSNDSSYLASDVADKIQYYFVKGRQFDHIIAGLRELTGESPMLPRWAFGYFQSRNRYKTKNELLGVVKKHRDLNIPLDAVILDYMHWGDKGFGSMVFDSIDFSQPEQMIDDLHRKYNCKLITSVWPSFNKQSANWQLFNKDSLFLGLDLGHFGDVYDAYNPKAGELYWSMVKKSYWDKGVDGIWFDATEPEQLKRFKNTQCYLGPTAKYQNLFSYFDMKNVFEPQLEIDTNRVFVLTRSAFLGQQKFGSVVWSGDIGTDFKTLKEQIPTGLNFCMTGIPYWNTDIGGYLGGDPSDENYQEVFVRWFQYGAFTPMFRAHGRRHPFSSRSGENEMWSFGAKNQEILTDMINLRYRLLPYIYTLSNKVHSDGYTLMRALVFDFINDESVYNIVDQFLVGNIMVCPVTEKGAVERKVYLPKGCDWFDFWTGKKHTGGQTIIAAAPIERIPLFVKSGTILPLADVMQYSSEKALDNIELRIYPGENADFVLYEDEGDNYNYKQGGFSTIQFTYNEEGNTVSVGGIKGEFEGMLQKRTYQITKVSEGVAVGIEKTISGNIVNYNGNAIKVKL